MSSETVSLDGHVIIDRRLNPRDKSLSNRQRFIERVRGVVKDSARKGLVKKGLKDKKDTNVSVPTDRIREPQFRHDPSSGDSDYVLPGNRDYSVGDKIKKPPKPDGGDGGPDASDGEGFDFALTHDEFVEIIMEDLDLPDMVKQSEKSTTVKEPRRAGFSTAGTPSSLDIEKSMGRSLMRRIALKFPKLRRIQELEQELAELRAKPIIGLADETRIEWIEAEIKRLRIAANAVQFLDPLDLRYRRTELVSKPGAKAVMFCLLDVSGSMGERERVIAKKFFMLLNLFLERRYTDIDIVFIRHHHEAEEVDEETFFGTGSTGGTIVSKAYQKAEDVMHRYPPTEWNIYFAQASDGDNMESDIDSCRRLMRKLLSVSQYYAYIEIARESHLMHEFTAVTTLWRTLSALENEFPILCMRQVHDDEEVVGVFRSLFDGTVKKEAA